MSVNIGNLEIQTDINKVFRLSQNINNEQNNQGLPYSIFNLLSVFVLVQRLLNYHPNYPIQRLYFGEVETLYRKRKKTQVKRNHILLNSFPYRVGTEWIIPLITSTSPNSPQLSPLILLTRIYGASASHNPVCNFGHQITTIGTMGA